jgi:hypothetical protein
MAPPIRKFVLGKKVTVNLNAKRGFRISPHPNERAARIGKCAKGKPLAARKACFAMK